MCGERPVSRILSGDLRLRDDHFSGTAVAGRLKRPTRESKRDGQPRSGSKDPFPPLYGLSPDGVYHATDVTAGAVGSYPTVSPLPRTGVASHPAGRRSILCCTFPGLAPGGRYPPSYPAESGLSSAPAKDAATVRAAPWYSFYHAWVGSPPGFDDLPDRLRGRVVQIVEAGAERAVTRCTEFEFTRYRIAAVAPADLAAEDCDTVQLVRAVVRCELRTRLAAAWPARVFDGNRAEMIVDVRATPSGARVLFEPMPAYVAGRYRKLVRGISQTVFHCRACRGRGRRRGEPCDVCAGAGVLAAEAVEDFVRPPIEEALVAEGSAFHGSGREDVDVRMLGEGRPFVVSLASPRRRSLDAEAVAARVAELSAGRVQVSGLRVVARADMSRITTEHGGKSYRVLVRRADGGALPADASERVLELSGVVLAQRTPRRVGRRADLVRERMLRDVVVEESRDDALVLRVATDPGLYVKEMVSGDEGRTTPSITQLLGVTCVCAELDVLGVDVPSVA